MTKAIKLGTSYLLWCAHELLNFKIEELCSIASSFNIDYEWLEEPSKTDPFLLINIASQADIMKIMSRTVLIRSAYELWSHGVSHPDLHLKLKMLPAEFLTIYSKNNQSFRIMVESFGKKISRDIKITRIEELDFLPLKGPIQLENPDNSFLLLEYYGTNPNQVPENPHRVFFGRWICDGQRKISQKISLKVRKFIGNTSMDPLLSLIMANMAKIQTGSLVLDPFVGSGSLLVAAAHFGGYVFGTDLDYLMLHGKAKPTRFQQKKREPDESIRANLRQYGLESNYLDVLVADASLSLWRSCPIFDAIITDPPYGIREATERIGTEKEYKIPDHLAAGHIPSKISYNLQDMLEDLLNFSAFHLKLKGRLVYWMPAYKEDFDKNSLPHHPCLKLVSYCEQGLTHHSSRYLITMEKVGETNVCIQGNSQSRRASVSETAKSFRYKYFQTHKKKHTQDSSKAG